MAGEWVEVTVGDFAPFAYGKGLPEHQRDPFGDIPVFGSNGTVGVHSEALTSGPTVIIGRKGTVGAVHFSPKPCWPIDTTFYVTDPDPNVLRFKYYLLKSLGLEHMNADSAVPGLNREAAHARKVRIPPLSDQRAIAHILGTLDDKIELNRRMSETLETMARALFKSWFVDFDPVRAKMEGRWQRGQSLPGLPDHLYDLFPDRLVDSELGEIPEGWGAGRFGEVVEHLRDQENPLSYPDVLYHHFSIPAFDEGQMPKLEYGESIKSLKWRVPAGVVLLSKLNPEIDRVWLVDIASTDRAVCSTEFLVLRARAPFARSFAYCLARSSAFRQQIKGLVTGTSKSHQRAQVDSILNLGVVLAPAAIARAFNAAAEGLLARALATRLESRTLAALRDVLLPKLISGELRVKDAERFLKERGL
jgi:type I restriction enzyme S subunit